jgi:hypothetical protein
MDRSPKQSSLGPRAQHLFAGTVSAAARPQSSKETVIRAEEPWRWTDRRPPRSTKPMQSIYAERTGPKARRGALRQRRGQIGLVALGDGGDHLFGGRIEGFEGAPWNRRRAPAVDQEQFGLAALAGNVS